MRTPRKILLPFLDNRYCRVSHQGVMNDYHDIVGKYSEIARAVLIHHEEYETLSQVYEESKQIDYDNLYYIFVGGKEKLGWVLFVPIQDSYSELYCKNIANQCGFSYEELTEAVIANR